MEHVLATQCLPQSRPKTFRIAVEGELPEGVTAKDIVLAIIGRIGTDGATGHVIEYAGSAIRALSMEGRMTVCNMSIEAGARAGMIAPDETTFAWLKGRPFAPQGAAWDEAVAEWRKLASDPGAQYDRELVIPAVEIEPSVTWGTNPGMVVSITGQVPDPAAAQSDADRRAWTRALEYMDLKAGTPIEEIAIDRVFIGSCTNSRIEDLRAAAKVVAGHRIHKNVRAMVVPGSQLVKAQAENEGLHTIFKEAGFEWREPGCSMCLGMNPDILQPGERCASTSNRNFEGRQGRGGRTHLVSPMMAAAAAIQGHFTDVRTWEFRQSEVPVVMEKFRTLTSKVMPLDRVNVDTDQIIPKQFLKRIERTGYGEFLFFDWRNDPGFELNNPRYTGREDPGGGAQLRLRIVARACGLGAQRLRLPLRHRAVFRRHLPLQRRQERHSAGHASGRAGADAARSRRQHRQLPADGLAGRKHDSRPAGIFDDLRNRPLPPRLPAGRAGRHRADAASRH